jgi:hypothetical protein
MSELGGLDKAPNGVVIGLVQLQLRVVATSADLSAQTARIVAMVGKARRNQLGHPGFTAVDGGAQDCPYTFMQDLVAGRYCLPWGEEVRHFDGTSCGFPKPRRRYGERLDRAAE